MKSVISVYIKPLCNEEEANFPFHYFCSLLSILRITEVIWVAVTKGILDSFQKQVSMKLAKIMHSFIITGYLENISLNDYLY